MDRAGKKERANNFVVQIFEISCFSFVLVDERIGRVVVMKERWKLGDTKTTTPDLKSDKNSFSQKNKNILLKSWLANGWIKPASNCGPNWSQTFCDKTKKTFFLARKWISNHFWWQFWHCKCSSRSLLAYFCPNFSAAGFHTRKRDVTGFASSRWRAGSVADEQASTEIATVCSRYVLHHLLHLYRPLHYLC